MKLLGDWIAVVWNWIKKFFPKNDKPAANANTVSADVDDHTHNSISGNNNTISKETKINSGNESNQQTINFNGPVNLSLSSEVKKAYLSNSSQAESRAITRMAEITEQVYSISPDLKALLDDPYLYSQLRQIQIEYARNGDENLRDLLVRFFCQLASQPTKTKEQVSYEEAIAVSPKITDSQFSILIFALLQRFPAFDEGMEFDDFLKYLKDKICPVSDQIDLSEPAFFTFSLDLDHLEQLGCVRRIQHSGSLLMQSKLCSGTSESSYLSRLFSKGVTKQELEANFGNLDRYENLLSKCFHDESKLQLKTFSVNTFIGRFLSDSVSAEDFKQLNEFFHRYQMDQTQIINLLIKKLPCMDRAFEISSMFMSYELTYLGILIAKSKYGLSQKEDIDIPQTMIQEIISRT